MVQYVWKYGDNSYVFLNGETGKTVDCSASSRARSFALGFVDDFDGYEKQFKANVMQYLGSEERSAYLYFNNACYVDSHDYLSFEATVDTVTIYFDYGTRKDIYLEYCHADDLYHWYKFPGGLKSGVELHPGAKIFVRGENSQLGKSFVIDGCVKCGGNVMSLLDMCGEITNIEKEQCFARLFCGCTGLLTAPKLPAVGLSNSCYYQMFRGCSSLLECPILPAETLQSSCYVEMFYDCSSLTATCDLNAKVLASSCYMEMFRGCSNLTTITNLNSYYLSDNCYTSMFLDCTSLKKPMETLPALELYEYCYADMFCGCTSLESVPDIKAVVLDHGCCYGMFDNCPKITKSPILYATELEKDCYHSMFHNCSSLSEITIYANTINSGVTYKWVENVSPKGTFNAPEGFSPVEEGVSLIPIGWLNRVSYQDNEGREIAEYNEKVLNGSLLTPRTYPDEEYYKFVGWILESEGKIWNYATDRVYGNIVLRPKMVPIEVEVKFYSTGDTTLLKSEMVTYGNQIPEPTDIKMIGCDLEGWYLSDGTKWNFNNAVMGNMSLYARWTVAKCQVKFNTYDRCEVWLNGKEVTSVEVNFGETVPNISIENIREGYDYAGMYTNAAFTWSFSPNVDKIYGDTTIFVRTEPELKYVTYHFYDGSTFTEITHYGALLKEPEIIVVDGHYYDGWYTTTGFTEGTRWIFDEDRVQYSMHLYVHYIPKQFTVSFDKNGHGGSSVITPVTADFGSTISAPKAPTDKNYTFHGWYKDTSFRYPWDFATDTVRYDITLYAKWEANTYEVVIKQMMHMPTQREKDAYIERGEISVYAKYGELLPDASYYYIYGYSLEGLYGTYNKSSHEFTNRWYLDTYKVMSSGLTLYGRYLRQDYTVDYEVFRKAVAPESKKVPYLDILPAAASGAPETVYTGYKFHGWYDSSNFYTPFDFNKRITKDTTIYGKFGLDHQWEVKFNNNYTSSGTPATELVWDGECCPEPTQPTRDAYIFKGWYKEADCINKWNFQTMPVYKDTELFAKWVTAKKKIKFNREYLIYGANGLTSASLDSSVFGFMMGVGRILRNNLVVLSGDSYVHHYISDFEENATSYSIGNYPVGMVTSNIKTGVTGEETIYVPYGYIINGGSLIPFNKTCEHMICEITAPLRQEDYITSHNPGKYFTLSINEDDADVINIQFVVKRAIPDNNWMLFNVDYGTSPTSMSIWHYSHQGTTPITLRTPTTTCLYYSYDSYIWRLLPNSSLGASKISVGGNINNVYLVGYNPSSFSTSYDDAMEIKMDNSSVGINVSGNISSLIDFSGKNKEMPCGYCFTHLFDGLNISEGSKIVLDATNIKSHGYAYTFKNCNVIPDLSKSNINFSSLTGTTNGAFIALFAYTPVTTNDLKNVMLTDSQGRPHLDYAYDYCYQSLFEHCELLTQAPLLTANTLGKYCYNNMFKDCISLTDLPALDIDVLGEHCCDGMFEGCTGIFTQSYTLDAPCLAKGCYNRMFLNCSNNLQTIKCLATSGYNDTQAVKELSVAILSGATQYWTNGTRQDSATRTGTILCANDENVEIAWNSTSNKKFGVGYWQVIRDES